MQSVIGKHSYSLAPGQSLPLRASGGSVLLGVNSLPVPEAHRRHSNAKLSLMSGTGILLPDFNPAELLGYENEYEASDSYASSASPG